MTATPTRFLGTDNGEQGRHWIAIGSYLKVLRGKNWFSCFHNHSFLFFTCQPNQNHKKHLVHCFDLRQHKIFPSKMLLPDQTSERLISAMLSTSYHLHYSLREYLKFQKLKYFPLLIKSVSST